MSSEVAYPAEVHVEPELEGRNRLTTLLRPLLALPHALLVGTPMAMGGSFDWTTDSGQTVEISTGSGLLGIAVAFALIAAWVALVVVARYPDALHRFVVWYYRWRVRATAYMMLLSDAYPPFGDGDYPARLELQRPAGARDRVTILLRLLLVLPHAFVLVLLGFGWTLTTLLAWFAILFTGRYPQGLYGFALGVFAWAVRVEAYVYLLTDTYPPFRLESCA